MKDGKLILVLVQGPRQSLENRYQYLYKGWDEGWKTDASVDVYTIILHVPTVQQKLHFTCL